jgi:hypothetical protein
MLIKKQKSVNGWLLGTHTLTKTITKIETVLGIIIHIEPQRICLFKGINKPRRNLEETAFENSEVFVLKQFRESILNHG